MNWYVLSKYSSIDHYYPRLIATLRKYKGQGLWVHFSHTPKLGINPKQSHRDPAGYYFFPLDHIAENPTKYSYFSFRKYIFVCQVNTKHPINISNMSDQQIDEIMKKVQPNRSVPKNEDKTTGKNLWDAVNRRESESGPLGPMDARKAWLNLGFDAIVDSGSSTIHFNEPHQILVLDPSIIRVVEMVESDTDSGNAKSLDEGYYHSAKYPFYGNSSRPVVFIVEEISKALKMKQSGPLRSYKKGSWAITLEDKSRNKMSISITLKRSGGADYKSFAASFSAKWYSNGREVYLSDNESPNSFRSVEYPFNTDTTYSKITKEFSNKVSSLLAENPMDDTSFVAAPLQTLAMVLNGKIELTNPLMGQVVSKIGENTLDIWLQYKAEERGYQASGNIKFKQTTNAPVSPSFGQYMTHLYQEDEISDKLLQDIAEELTQILDRNYKIDDKWRGSENRFAHEQVGIVIKKLLS